MATAEVLLLVAATTFVAGIVAHAVWQARGWPPVPPRRRCDGGKQQQRAEEEGDETIHLDSLDSSSSTVVRPHQHQHLHPRRRPPSHDTLETPPHPSPPPTPPLPLSTTTTRAGACPDDEWIAKAGATDSWSEAVTGLEEEARDVW